MKRQMASADDHDVCMISHLQPLSQAIGTFSEEDFLDSKVVSKEFPSNQIIVICSLYFTPVPILQHNSGLL